MTQYPETLLGCPTIGGYGVTENPTATVLEALKGRPRYRLRDEYPVYLINLTFDFSDSQFNGWQSFWASLRGGVDSFQMNLILDVITGTLLECHATGPFSVQQTQGQRWVVTLQVEGLYP